MHLSGTNGRKLSPEQAGDGMFPAAGSSVVAELGKLMAEYVRDYARRLTGRVPPASSMGPEQVGQARLGLTLWGPTP